MVVSCSYRSELSTSDSWLNPHVSLFIMQEYESVIVLYSVNHHDLKILVVAML